MDIGAPSYAKPENITRVGRGYIDKVAPYRGGTWANISIHPDQVRERALDLVIPPGATPDQRKALEGLVDYGRRKGVGVNIVEIQ